MAYMKRLFLDRSKKLNGPKISGPQTGTVFEPRERADFNCLAGARGPESIWSGDEALKPENGVSKSPIFHWFYKVFRVRENALRKPSVGNAFSMFWGPFSVLGPRKLNFPLVL